MKFDAALLETYHTLLQTTDLQKGYQEFIRLFRYLRVRMEQQMKDCRFQSGITENAMDYAYFSFTHPRLKEQGLKLVTVFVHDRFQLEVWLSGVNRSAQRRWAKRLGDCPLPMEVSKDPARTDYLVRLPVQADLSDGDAAADEIQAAAETMLSFLSLQG